MPQGSLFLDTILSCRDSALHTITRLPAKPGVAPLIELSMERTSRFLSSLILAGALCAPLMMHSLPAVAQDEHHDQDRDRDRDRAQNRDRDNDRDRAQNRDRDNDRDNANGRYYDRSRRDYHQWNTQEDGYYRQWLNSRHRQYEDFGSLNSRDQQNYWKWRHKHGDNDRDDRNRDRDHDRDHDRH